VVFGRVKVEERESKLNPTWIACFKQPTSVDAEAADAREGGRIRRRSNANDDEWRTIERSNRNGKGNVVGGDANRRRRGAVVGVSSVVVLL
jgi:hypothetical protein